MDLSVPGFSLSPSLVLALLVGSLSVFLLWKCLSPKNVIERVASKGNTKGIPQPKKLQWYRHGLPIVGPAIEFRSAPNELLLRAQKELGDVFGLDLLARRFVFLLGPEANRWFFNADDGTGDCELSFEKAVQGLVRHLFDDVMFDTPGWPDRARRLTIAGLGTLDRLTYYTSVIQDEIDDALAEWARKGTVDLHRECSRLAMALQIRCLLGDDVSERFPELKDLYYDFERLAALPEVAQFGWFPSAAARRFKKLKARIFAILETVVQERLADRDAHHGRPDYAQFVLENSPEYPQIVPVHLLSLMFAGHVNTAGTMGWNIAYIAFDEALRSAVCAEVRDPSDAFARGASISSMTAAAIGIAANRSELPLLDKCMRETNRLFGILLLVRKVLKSTSFNGFELPKGTTVVNSPYVLHRDESVYRDAQNFNPYRFTKPALEELHLNRQYVPFGAGRHACQGLRFVTIILRLVWTTLFREYDVKVLNTELPEPEYFGALGTPLPKAPVMLRVVRRTSAAAAHEG